MDKTIAGRTRRGNITLLRPICLRCSKALGTYNRKFKSKNDPYSDPIDQACHFSGKLSAKCTECTRKHRPCEEVPASFYETVNTLIKARDALNVHEDNGTLTKELRNEVVEAVAKYTTEVNNYLCGLGRFESQDSESVADTEIMPTANTDPLLEISATLKRIEEAVAKGIASIITEIRRQNPTSRTISSSVPDQPSIFKDIRSRLHSGHTKRSSIKPLNQQPSSLEPPSTTKTSWLRRPAKRRGPSNDESDDDEWGADQGSVEYNTDEAYDDLYNSTPTPSRSIRGTVHPNRLNDTPKDNIIGPNHQQMLPQVIIPARNTTSSVQEKVIGPMRSLANNNQIQPRQASTPVYRQTTAELPSSRTLAPTTIKPKSTILPTTATTKPRSSTLPATTIVKPKPSTIVAPSNSQPKPSTLPVPAITKPKPAILPPPKPKRKPTIASSSAIVAESRPRIPTPKMPDLPPNSTTATNTESAQQRNTPKPTHGHKSPKSAHKQGHSTPNSKPTHSTQTVDLTADTSSSTPNSVTSPSAPIIAATSSVPPRSLTKAQKRQKRKEKNSNKKQKRLEREKEREKEEEEALQQQLETEATANKEATATPLQQKNKQLEQQDSVVTRRYKRARELSAEVDRIRAEQREAKRVKRWG